MLVVAVAERSQRQRGLRVGEGDHAATGFGGEGRGDLERGERVTGVALGAVGEVDEGVVVDLEVLVAEATLLVGEGTAQERPQVVDAQRLEPEERGARQQRAGEREERVLGGGADQDEQPFLHVREQRVLLGPVEAVHLVEEEDGAATLLAHAGAGALGDLAHVLDPGRDRRQRLERLAGRAGDEAGDGGLAGAGRSPEDHRREPVGLDEDAQRPAGPEQLLLADHLVERARPQAGRQRRPALEPLGDGGAEEVVGHRSMVRPRRVRHAMPPLVTDRARSVAAKATRGPRRGFLRPPVNLLPPSSVFFP